MRYFKTYLTAVIMFCAVPSLAQAATMQMAAHISFENPATLSATTDGAQLTTSVSQSINYILGNDQAPTVVTDGGQENIQFAANTSDMTVVFQ